MLSIAPAIRSRRRTERLRPEIVCITVRAPSECDANESESAPENFVLMKEANSFPAEIASLPSTG